MAVNTLAPWSGADGAVPTMANTGYDGVAIGGGTALFDDSWQPRGKNSIDMNGTSTPGYVYGHQDFADTDVIAFDQPIKPVTLPASETGVLFFGNGETRQVAIGVFSDGKVIIRDRPNANIWLSAAGALQVGVGSIISVYLVRHATAGQIRVVIYAEDGTTIRADSGLLTGRNTGDLPITRVKSSMAKSSSSSTVVARHRFGVPRWDTAASGLLPAWTTHSPFRAWSGGAYVSVRLMRWNGSGYESIAD